MAPKSEKIYDAAIRLFAEHSYSETTMRDISEAVGILPGSLYTHIASKEALLLEIVERGIDMYLEAIDSSADSSVPADERMRGAIKAYLAVLAEHRDQTVVAFEQWRHLSEEVSRKRVIKKRNAYEKAFTRIVTDGISSGVFGGVSDSRLTVLAVIGMLNSVPMWFTPSGRHTADEVGDALADLVLKGLTVDR